MQTMGKRFILWFFPAVHENVKAHIIIGTPGKIMDWAFRHKFFDITKIRVFVLDEADVMIATQGYRDQSIKLRK